MANSATAPTTTGHDNPTGTGHFSGPEPIVAHHFNNLLQQQSTQRLGMWLFLVTEVLFFGGIFCAYTAYRIWYPKEFEASSTALNPAIAGLNSFLLLISSFTCTLAIRAAYQGSRKGLQLWLAATILLGTTFLGFKAREYYVDYQEGLVPNPNRVLVVEKDESGNETRRTVSVFGQKLEHALKEKKYYRDNPKALAEVNLDRAQLFFIFYYTMTGLHVVHMIVGIGLLVWQFILASFGFFDHKERYVYVEVLSLYWHFVELVWIFLLPLLYMAGHHSAEHLHF
ncbi:MAG: cytochrome c oxidase subunit 3 [Gemmataceae bacterium]